MDDVTWKKFAPWFLTIASTAVMVGLGYYLVSNIEWFKDTAFSSKHSVFSLNSKELILQGFYIHSSLIKRSVSMFAGVGVLLIGFGVSFYTIDRMTNANFKAGGLGFQLATASPGIVAMFVGASLIITSVVSKDSFNSKITVNEEIEHRKIQNGEQDKPPARLTDPCKTKGVCPKLEKRSGENVKN